MTGDGLVLWTGWDLRTGANADPAGVAEFARSAPVEAASGARYEFLAVAARGFRPPNLISATPVGGEAGEAGAAGATGIGEEPDRPGLRRTWTLVYRTVTETAPAGEGPFAIYLLGVDPPADATDDDLVVFNDFYTHVHLPEVAERRHALRAVRYELVEEIRPPPRGAPRFLAVYEVGEESAANRRHTGPPYATGPDVWQRHTTPWRLWYRRLVPPGQATLGAGT